MHKNRPVFGILDLLIPQNIDAGTMSPFEHGEVFVLEDGSEVDLDLGKIIEWKLKEIMRDFWRLV